MTGLLEGVNLSLVSFFTFRVCGHPTGSRASRIIIGFNVEANAEFWFCHRFGGHFLVVDNPIDSSGFNLDSLYQFNVADFQ